MLRISTSRLLALVLAYGSLSSLTLQSAVLSAELGVDKSQKMTAAAQTTGAGSKGADNASTAGAAADTPAAELAALKTEQTQLRQMGEAVKRTNRASLDIIGECTQPIEMMGEIDIIGQDIIPIMPATAEGFGNHYMPPRPKYINLHMAQLNSIVPILQDEIDKLVIPPAEKAIAAQALEDLRGCMGDLQLHVKKLQDATVNKTDFDVLVLTSEARGIDSCCKCIEEARKKLLHDDAQVQRQEQKEEKKQEKGAK